MKQSSWHLPDPCPAAAYLDHLERWALPRASLLPLPLPPPQAAHHRPPLPAQVPPAISQLASLTSLDLSHNMLEGSGGEELAPLAALPRLACLHLAGLKLACLPAWLAGLQGLAALEAGGNRALGAAVLGSCWAAEVAARREARAAQAAQTSEVAGLGEAGEQQEGAAAAAAAAAAGSAAAEAPAGEEKQRTAAVPAQLSVLLQLPGLRRLALPSCSLPDGCLAGLAAAARAQGRRLQCTPAELLHTAASCE
jgi:hypothetical protein